MQWGKQAAAWAWQGGQLAEQSKGHAAWRGVACCSRRCSRRHECNKAMSGHARMHAPTHRFSVKWLMTCSQISSGREGSGSVAAAAPAVAPPAGARASAAACRLVGGY